LKKAVDLRQVDAGKDKRNQTLQHSTDERRAARRELRTLAKKEEMSEKVQMDDAKREAEAEAMREAGFGGAGGCAGGVGGVGGAGGAGGVGGVGSVGGGRGGGVGPVPSLLPVAVFLMDRFVKGMPNERCKACGKSLLPPTPAVHIACVAGERRARPVRVYCGHWYHHCCLDRFLKRPPFNKPCPDPECGQTVFHHKWERDVARLEKDWGKMQAKKEEEAVWEDFFGDAYIGETEEGGSDDDDPSLNLFDDC
jgi:hypothetical protein